MQQRAPLVVLVAEDDLALRYLAKRQLARLGFACELAEDGAEAVEKARNGKYALIIMDVQMPIMNGLEATVAIRINEGKGKGKGKGKIKSPTPIIAMTANPNRQQCFDAGMNDFLFKPLLLTHMEQMLNRWLPKTA